MLAEETTEGAVEGGTEMSMSWAPSRSGVDSRGAPSEGLGGGQEGPAIGEDGGVFGDRGRSDGEPGLEAMIPGVKRYFTLIFVLRVIEAVRRTSAISECDNYFGG